MLKESAALSILLFNSDGSYADKYIGRIQSCTQASTVIKRYVKAFNIPNHAGYICKPYYLKNKNYKIPKPMPKPHIKKPTGEQIHDY